MCTVSDSEKEKLYTYSGLIFICDVRSGDNVSHAIPTHFCHSLRILTSHADEIKESNRRIQTVSPAEIFGAVAQTDF